MPGFQSNPDVKIGSFEKTKTAPVLAYEYLASGPPPAIVVPSQARREPVAAALNPVAPSTAR